MWFDRMNLANILQSTKQTTLYQANVMNIGLTNILYGCGYDRRDTEYCNIYYPAITGAMQHSVKTKTKNRI